jgi:DNA repair protein RecN (Recombination protein N)
MLCTLRIRDLVIVDDLTVEFGPGLNLLTGETGAGKSILIDALGWIVGDRVERSAIRSGRDRAVVEALFEVEPGSAAAEWAHEQGLDEIVEEGQLTVRREMAATGGGRAWINGSPATLGTLRGLGRRLLEIHGQHDQQGLLATERHLRLLDRFGAHELELERVGLTYDAVESARGRLQRLRSLALEREAAIDRLQQTVREIEAVAPRPGEMDELDLDRRRLRNAAGLTSKLAEVAALLEEQEPSALELASRAARSAEAAAELDPSLDETAARLRSAVLELEDVNVELRDYLRRQDFDPARLEDLESRRAALEELMLRHGLDERGLLERCDEARTELAGLQDIETELGQARGAVEAAEKEYVRAARQLGAAREAASKRLRVAVEKQLAALALAKARFDLELSPAAGDSVTRGAEAVPLGPRGAERAEFRLAANPGEPFRPLQRVASGGELSRVMLALHVVVEPAGRGKVMVFDEVDAGVGGAVADAVGARLAALARHGQVLCVTHLPQVAAYADGHYFVKKEIVDGRTRADIAALDGGERVEELARMLGGKRATEASRRHAGELLRAASATRSGKPGKPGSSGTRPAPARRAR